MAADIHLQRLSVDKLTAGFFSYCFSFTPASSSLLPQQGDRLLIQEQSCPVIDAQNNQLTVVGDHRLMDCSMLALESRQIKAAPLVSDACIFYVQDAALFLLPWLAHQIKAIAAQPSCLIVAGVKALWPFKPAPSRIMVAGLPPHVTACVPLLDDLGIASRLASTDGAPGCYEGDGAMLADVWRTYQMQTQQKHYRIVEV